MFKYVNNEKGSALVVILIVMAVGMILGTTLLTISNAETRFAFRQEHKTQAYYIARTGAVSVAEYMMADPGGAANLVGDESEEMDFAGGTFVVSVTEEESLGNVVVEAVGEYNGVTQRAKIEMEHTSEMTIGEFDHAIAAKSIISINNNSGQGLEIEGSIEVLEEGEINSIIKERTSGDVDESMTHFPALIEPDGFDVTYSSITSSITFAEDLDVKVEGDVKFGNGSIRVHSNSDVHMFVYGEIDLGPNAELEVEEGSRLFIYVVGGGDVEFRGASKHENNNVMILAPQSTVEWRNATHGTFNGVIYADTVILHNHGTVKYNPIMSSGAYTEMPGIGVTYTGYSWLD